MVWLVLGQWWFAFRGKFSSESGVVVSKDGLWKRLKMAWLMTFSPVVFSQVVQGQAGKIAETIVNEKIKADTQANLAKKAQRKRSMKARR